MFRNAYVTAAIIGINILVYVIETLAGGSEKTDTAIRFGAFYVPKVREGQWYRLITAMFVHFGVFHIICNMYSLYNLGPALERFFGWREYLLLYLLSGIAGNAATWLVEMKKGRYSVSAGASGAVFGLLGAWLMLTLMPQVRTSVSSSAILYTLIINAAYGFANRRINMTAHAGGFICGAALTATLVLA